MSRPVVRAMEQGGEARAGLPSETGVLLAHVGGPRSEEEVEAYSLALWRRAAVGLARPFAGLSARRRWRRLGDEIRRRYGLVGGRSVAPELASALARAVENAVAGRPLAAPRAPTRVRVVAGCVLSSPRLDEAARALAEAQVRRVLVLPLYGVPDPFLWRWASEEAAAALERLALEVEVGRPWLELPQVVDRFARSLAHTLDLFPPDLRGEAEVVFVAPPWRGARRYARDLDRAAAAVTERLGRRLRATHLAAQPTATYGKPGVENVREVVRRRAAAGARAIALAPLTYVVDGFESLHELDVEVYGIGLEAGAKQVRRVPAPNVESDWVRLVAASIERWNATCRAS